MLQKLLNSTQQLQHNIRRNGTTALLFVRNFNNSNFTVHSWQRTQYKNVQLSMKTRGHAQVHNMHRLMQHITGRSRLLPSVLQRGLFTLKSYAGPA